MCCHSIDRRKGMNLSAMGPGAIHLNHYRNVEQDTSLLRLRYAVLAKHNRGY